MSTDTSTLTTFFKGSDTKFGIFYPAGYLVAVFADPAIARRAEDALGFAGFLDDDVISVPGEEVVRFAEDHLQHTSLWGMLMQKLSLMFATEEIYADHDLKLARGGAGFLAVHCPTGKSTDEAWKIIQPFGPVRARHYALDGIRHFKGEL